MPDTTRADHMRWCKQRALYELDRSGPGDCLDSFGSDIAKHPDTANLDVFMLTGVLHLYNPDGMRKWIEGFPE